MANRIGDNIGLNSLSPGTRTIKSVDGGFVQDNLNLQNIRIVNDIISDNNAFIYNDIKISNANSLKRMPKQADIIKNINQSGSKISGKKAGILTSVTNTNTTPAVTINPPRAFPLEKNWEDIFKKK